MRDDSLYELIQLIMRSLTCQRFSLGTVDKLWRVLLHATILHMYSTRDLVKDMWSYIRPYKNSFWFATILRIIIDLAWLYPPYAAAVLVNFFTDYIPGKSLTLVYWTFFLLIFTATLRHFGMYFVRMKMYQVAEKINLDAQLRSLKHLMLLDMSWHEKENAGNKFKRIERGGESLNQLLRIWIMSIIEIFINFVGIIFIILTLDRNIAIAITFFLITYYVISRFYRKKGVAASEIVNRKEEHRSGIIFESINNIRSVKVMSMSKKIIDMLITNAKDLFTEITRRVYWFQIGNAVRNYYAHLFDIGVSIFIVYGIIQGDYTVGFLVLFTGYFKRAYGSMSELTEVTEQFAVAKIAVARMQEILATPIVIDNEKNKIKFPDTWDTISFKNVSFSYQDSVVLNKVSFEVKKGEKVGIVGLSGAGKSTLFKLLLKERESYDGDIVINNVSLKNISKTDHFNHVAVVLQDTELFNASLKENITITNQKEERNIHLLNNAIEIAHVKDFISKLPNGVESIIGEKGIKLSGGEKQRVGIARAIFKQPEILLLDEATSHLDIESEEKIQDSLHKFFKNVTAIVIAHRLTTIKEMDKIIVLENGKIVESGSFDELFEKKGRFFTLWEKQKL